MENYSLVLYPPLQSPWSSVTQGPSIGCILTQGAWVNPNVGRGWVAGQGCGAFGGGIGSGTVSRGGTMGVNPGGCTGPMQNLQCWCCGGMGHIVVVCLMNMGMGNAGQPIGGAVGQHVQKRH